MHGVSAVSVMWRHCCSLFTVLLLTPVITDNITHFFKQSRNLKPNMQIILKRCRNLFKNNFVVLQRLRWQSYSTPITQEFTVSPFCNLKVQCRFNIVIQPLNVMKYYNQDKVIINMLCSKSTHNPIVKFAQNDNNIDIFSTDANPDCLCLIEAPVKANIEVASKEGSVSIGSFENDYIKVESTSGNVTVDKFQGDTISITTIDGNITCEKNTQAANINLTTGSGTIKTAKLQGLNLTITTDSGNVTTQASYCDNTAFKSNRGNLQLNSVHKNCKIHVEGKGNVNLTGFDGILEMVTRDGSVNILLSRITGDSSIVMENEGLLTLMISESCQDDTQFNIAAKDCSVDDKFIVEKCSPNLLLLKPKINADHMVSVDCKNSLVNIKSTTILEMFQLLK